MERTLLKNKEIIVALTGASGIDYGIEVIKALAKNNIITHVIISKWAEIVIQNESKTQVTTRYKAF